MKEILELISKIDWAESVYKTAFLIVAVVLIYAIAQGVKFFGKRLIAILESGQKSIKELTELSKKMDTKIELIQQEQEFQNLRLKNHDDEFMQQNKKFDDLINSLIKATQR